ncbi:MAG: hypothetical protein JW790_03395 [Dehalococcoidales bacterium]|nr:hypothetical protein [Dehalococcoidales bacterium]
MNYWMTTHWPPFLKDKPNPPSPLPDPGYFYRVYLPDGREQAGQEMREGDYVFIYESKTGRTLKNGEEYAVGRQGVVALVRVFTSIQEIPSEEPDEYQDGSIICWKWQAITQVKELGFCSRDNVCRILDYSADYAFHGFGDQHSGLKRLTREEFEPLLYCFRAGI